MGHVGQACLQIDKLFIKLFAIQTPLYGYESLFYLHKHIFVDGLLLNNSVTCNL